MNRRAQDTPDGLPRTGRAAVLYDHYESLLSAYRLIGWLPRKRECRLNSVDSWRFDMLGKRGVAARALVETAGIELLVLAIGNAGAMCRLPTKWIEDRARMDAGRGAGLSLALIGTNLRFDAVPLLNAWIQKKQIPYVDLASLACVEDSLSSSPSTGGIPCPAAAHKS